MLFGSSSAMAMSQLTPTTPPKHDVFLSFRGEDTRDNFISHLYAELRRKKVETFIDYRLGRGEEISPSLCKAIEESMIYVIVLSEHYASSTWCLDELTNILECKRRFKRDVIPVFYRVDPSNVRHQRGSYAEAFVKHGQRFRGRMDKVDAWKAALTQVAGLSGWDSHATRPEHTLVAEIVKDILRRLNHSFSSDHQGMIGIDKHVEQIQSLLHLESAAVRIIGIWGMAGIGKTTIASALYRKLAPQFSSSSIVLNAQQEIERDGVHNIQSKYLSELLDEDKMSSGSKFSRDQRLERTKVLLVLDDVNDSDFVERHYKFGQGSRIIVTSRDMQVLKNADVDEIYEVKEMSFRDSLQLFSVNAFKQNYPPGCYVGLSEKVLNYAKGVPIALKVLGLLLRGRTREAWESELQKLEKLPNLKILGVLKLSYDGLDEEQKEIFLDIACFYRGHLESAVAQTLDGCGFSAHIGIEVLKDRCLMSISEGRIVMHDLIQELGQEIVRRQCVNDPGKRSRLWKHEEIYHVLRKNKGTDAIQCIFLDICKIKKVQLHAETFKKMQNLRMIQFYKPPDFPWNDSNVILPEVLESLPDDLKFLRWDNFPHRSLPLEICPENLVKLDMRHSHLEQLWEGDQDLPNLKRLDLSYSRKLIRVPDLCVSPNIEEIILNGCVSLVQVYSSSSLSKLNCLCLDGCVVLTSLNLPSSILSRSSGLVVLYGCYKLETFSISSRTQIVPSHGRSPCDGSGDAIKTSALDTDIEGNGIGYWIGECSAETDIEGDGIGHRIGEYSAETFDPSVSAVDGNEIEDPVDFVVGDGIGHIIGECSAETVDLSVSAVDRNEMEDPDDFVVGNGVGYRIGEYSSDTFDPSVSAVDGNEIEDPVDFVVGDGIGHRIGECSAETVDLSVSAVDRNEMEDPDDFVVGNGVGYRIGEYSSDTFDPSVSAIDRNEMEDPVDNIHLLNMKVTIHAFPSLCTSINELCWLDISDCESLTSLPTDLFKLKFLGRLYLGGCSNLEEFPEIEETMENLTVLILDRTAIKELPSSLDRLVGLEQLSLHNCSRLEIIPSSIGSLSKLCKLDIAYCESLETFPSSIFKLRLTKLDLHGCSMLRTFPQILEPAESYAHVNLTRTAIKELPSSLEYLVGLQTLRLNLCSDLVSLPNSIVNLNLLSLLDCSGCSMLTEIPNNIGRLSSLRELSLQESSIVNLPESIAHLSSLKSLDLSDCKKLECIPQLPPVLEQLLAFDCPSIRKVMSNSRFDSKEGTFKFHFTNGQELDESAQNDLAADARMRILQDAYRSVFFCFPGNAAPHWFPYRCQGHSVTTKVDSLDSFNDNMLIGFAMCVVLGHVDVDDTEAARGGGSFRFRLTFESDGCTFILPNHDELRNYFYWKGQDRFVVQDHTFIWKYHLGFASIDQRRLFHAQNFTFEISKHDDHQCFRSTSTMVKECGICPLYQRKG